MDRLDERISRMIETALDGSSLRFALVLWVEHLPDQPDAVAVNAHPQDRQAVLVALATALAALKAVEATNLQFTTERALQAGAPALEEKAG